MTVSELVSLFTAVVDRHNDFINAKQVHEAARAEANFAFADRKTAKAERDAVIKKAESAIKTLKSQN